MQTYTRTCAHACKRTHAHMHASTHANVHAHLYIYLCKHVPRTHTRAMKRFPGRCAADSLSVMQCQSLENDLQSWIDTQRQAPQYIPGTTWRFGMYGEMDAERDILKMAPHIQDLLVNQSLWKVLLSYFPSGRFRDKYLVDIMHQLLSRSSRVNDTKMKETVFPTWVCKCVHASMSHIRAVALYPAKFAYRVKKLSPEEKTQLQELIDLVAPRVDRSSSQEFTGSEPSTPSLSSKTGLPHVPRPSSKTPEEDGRKREASGCQDADGCQDGLPSPLPSSKPPEEEARKRRREASGGQDDVGVAHGQRLASVLAAFSEAHVRSQAQSNAIDPTHHSRKSGSEQPPQKKQKLQQEARQRRREASGGQDDVGVARAQRLASVLAAFSEAHVRSQAQLNAIDPSMLPRCVPLPAARGGIKNFCEKEETPLEGANALAGHPTRKSTPPSKGASPFELQTLIGDLGLPHLSGDHAVRSMTCEQHGLYLTQIRGNGAVVQLTKKAFGDNFEAAGNVLISACRSGYCKEDLERMKKEMLKTSKGV